MSECTRDKDALLVAWEKAWARLYQWRQGGHTGPPDSPQQILDGMGEVLAWWRDDVEALKHLKSRVSALERALEVKESAIQDIHRQKLQQECRAIAAERLVRRLEEGDAT